MTMLKTVLCALLTFAFLMSGGNKLTDAIHKDTYQTLSAEFRTNFGPLWKKIAADTLKFPQGAIKVLIDDDNSFTTFKRNVGILEVFSALMLWTPQRSIGGWILAFVMAAGAYTHVALNDGKTVVPAVLMILSIIVALPSQPARPVARKGKNSKKD